MRRMWGLSIRVLARFIAFAMLAASIEAVAAHHIPYDSWQEPFMLAIAAVAWVLADELRSEPGAGKTEGRS